MAVAALDSQAAAVKNSGKQRICGFLEALAYSAALLPGSSLPTSAAH